ncbi:hypothetical protein FH972_025448 [Carpinus fangiana]|uniref:AAA+ ATPase domain-containing protein n=1 Tax=Carpinus fangiana TaxID=176857 RepID=A0A5N6L1B1_9ROSI|nr:hypothetical protein FH972_025448 [Carpinus fangiana]
MDRLQKYLIRNMGTNETVNGPSLIDTVPSALLDSFIPGFGLVSRIFSTYFGIDLSRIVTTVFVFAAFLTAVRQARRIFWYWIDANFTANVTILSNDDLYDHVMDWISDHIVTEHARELTATTRRDHPWNARSAITANSKSITNKSGAKMPIFNFKDFDARFPPSFKPAHGTHRFWFQGRIFWIYREVRVSSNRLTALYGSSQEEETIRLMTLGRRTEPIKRLLDECKSRSAAKQRESTSVRYPDTGHGHSYWRRAGTRPTRPLDTIYLEEEKKVELLEDLQDFLQPSAWRFYSRRGIPYRRGYLFYGQPGTGKTSLSLAIAGMFGLSLQVLSLADPAFTDQSLNQLFASLPSSCIVLMEDIDTVAVSRKADGTLSEEEAKKKEEEEEAKKKEKEEEEEQKKSDNKSDKFNKRNAKGGAQGVTLSGLLNAIDGVASQEGRILIMTTNAPEALDPALVRPGRVDMQVYFGFLTRPCARQMFITMFGDDEQLLSAEELREMNLGGKTVVTDETTDALSPEQLAAAKQAKDDKAASVLLLAEKFADLIPEGSLTPAEVQGFLLRRRRAPQRAIDELGAWAEETIAAKAKGLNVVKQIEEARETAGDDTHKDTGAEKKVNGTNGKKHRKVKVNGIKAINGVKEVNGFKEVNGVENGAE